MIVLSILPTFIILTIVLTISLLLMGLFIFIFYNQENKYKKKKIEKIINKDTFLEIDYLNKIVYTYNIKDGSFNKENNYNDFLNYIVLTEERKFDEWINDVLTTKFDPYSRDNVNVFTTIKDKNKNAYQKSLFSIYSVDKKNKRIIIEVSNLKNISFYQNTKSKNKDKFTRIVHEYGEIVQDYESGYFLKGFAVTIFFRKKDGAYQSLNLEKVKYKIIEALSRKEDALFTYFYFRNPEEFEINILDKRTITKHSLKRQITKIIERLNYVFEINCYDEIFEYFLVAGLCQELERNPHKMHEQLESLYNQRINDETNYVIFETSKSDDFNETIFKNEFYKISREQAIDTTFQPIYRLNNQKITNYGYLTDFIINSGRFDEFEKLLNVAEVYKSVKNVYSIALRKAIPPYLNQRENFFSKLVIPIELKFIMEVLPVAQKNSKIGETHLVFLVDISELLESANMSETLKIIKNIHSKGYEIAAMIEQFDFKTDKELFAQIDCFFIKSDLGNNIKNDSKEFLRIHNALDRLIGFKKPLIVYNSLTLIEIELFYKAGISYFASSTILAPNPNIVSLDKKITKKLTNIMKL